VTKLGLRLFFAFALVAAAASTARAYVRTTTAHDDTTIKAVPVQWNVRCIGMTADTRGSRDLMLRDVQAALGRSVKAWNDATGGCGGLLLSAASDARALDVGQDGFNAVVFRNDKWQRPGGQPYDPSIIALTTVIYVDSPGHVGDGTLLDADIEVNNVNYTFSTSTVTATTRAGTSPVNLENTLTHELGHVQGLAHTCWDHTTIDDPIDNTGQPIPDCNDTLSDTILNSIMYPFYTADTPDRPLTSDDISGVCDVYSKARLGCWHDLRGGCESVPEAPAPPGGSHELPLATAAVLAASTAWAWRRRARRGRPLR
jgi:hypothetical protein